MNEIYSDDSHISIRFHCWLDLKGYNHFTYGARYFG